MSTDGVAWHRALIRQLNRAGLSESEIRQRPELVALMNLISTSYDDADQQRYLDDRAFELSSRELTQLNEQLRQASASRLAQQRDRLRAVFDSVDTGLVVLDADHHVADLNPAARTLLGISSLGWSDLPLSVALQPADHDDASRHALAALQHAIDNGERWRQDDLHLRTDAGAEFPGNLAFSPLVIDDTPAGGVLSVSDVSERARAAAEMAWRASHDALTGLINRTALMEHLNRLLEWRSREPGGSSPHQLVGLLFIDLDRFKLVNDTLGHAAGDRLLITAVERITMVIRQHDTLARLGGDEFVILCEHAEDSDEVMQVAERVVEALSRPFALGPDIAYVSASIGVTVSTGASTAASLLRDADVALYRAKDGGRGHAVLFDQSMHDEVAERVRLERQLRHALDADALSLAFQPVFRSSDGTLAGFESLVRWEGPGFHVEPQVFVTLAEDTGLVGIMGDWVLESAAAFLTELHRSGITDLSLSVNLSALQLNDPELPARVADVVARLEAPPDHLMLEITETALLADPDLARERLTQLRSCGVQIALDDFGTGYSSLSALRDFPLDALKIDKSFVSGVTDSARDRAIVSAVITLGHALNMTVIAEGTETVEQRDVVMALGCDRIQGFIMSRPLTESAATRLAAAPRIPLWDQSEGIPSGPVFASGK